MYGGGALPNVGASWGACSCVTAGGTVASAAVGGDTDAFGVVPTGRGCPRPPPQKKKKNTKQNLTQLAEVPFHWKRLVEEVLMAEVPLRVVIWPRENHLLPPVFLPQVVLLPGWNL